MVNTNHSTCRHCIDWEQRCCALQAENDQLHAAVEDLKEQLAAAKKDSTTSHKPPSSDLVKPPRTPTNGKPGGQPGHPGHFRNPYVPEELTGRFDYQYCQCPDCGGQLDALPEPVSIIQQVDVHEIQQTIEEHRSYASWCSHCDKKFIKAIPDAIASHGLLGPQLRTLIAYLKAVCHASFSTVRKYFRDVLQIKVSRGYLAKVIRQVSDALAGPYEELLLNLAHEPFLNVDETSHPHHKERWWTWCFRAELYVLYRIDPTRSAEVLIELLGQEFKGVLGCDQFSAYHRYLGTVDIRVQWCLAHLIREVKFLTTLPGQAVRAYGERFREALRNLFGVIHQRERLSERAFQKQLRTAKEYILMVSKESVPDNKYCYNLAERMRKHGQGYFTFITTPGVDPTNNAAEQAIRFVVIDRYITQGTRSVWGVRWNERIWTVVATCAVQGKSVYRFLRGCIEAHAAKNEKPSLLPGEDRTQRKRNEQLT